MGQKHKHHDVIVAWAAGAEIQIYEGFNWVECHRPHWAEKSYYRIKPEPPAKSYPVTGMSSDDLYQAWCAAGARSEFISIANAALRHAIDNELLVDPVTYCEEVREAVGRRKKSRDMAIAKAVEEAVTNEWKCCGSIPLYDMAAIIASVKD